MVQFIGSILDTLLMVGFGVFVFFQPQKLASKAGTTEQVERRVRLLKQCGAGLVIAGIGLFVLKLFT